MKKIIALLLVLSVCLSLALVGCSEKSEAPADNGLEKAAKYLRALYNEAAVETGVDYTRTTVVPVGKVQYSVSWSVDVSEDLVKIVAGTNNTVTVDVNEDNQTETNYKLTATVTDAKGNKETVVFDHILPKAAPKDGTEMTVKEIIDLGASKEHNTYTELKYKVTGVITEVYNTQYGNMKITDSEGNILTIYGTYSADGSARYDAMEVKPVAGDTVTIYGIVGQYNGTPQIKNGWIVAHTPGEGGGNTEPPAPPVDEPADGTEFSVQEIIAMGSAKEHNTYTTNKFKVTGVITEVYNEQYGNMKIKDAAGNILTIYGTYSADGSTRYDAMATKPVAGDTVTIYGIVGQYNGTPQIKNGWIVAHTPAGGSSSNPTEPPVTEPPVTEPANPSVPTTLAGQLAEASKLANKEYLSYESTITGTITDDPAASSYTAGQFKFTVSDGTNTVLCYYTPVSGGTPKKGDTVTVTGKLTAYNGTAQFDSKAAATLKGGSGSTTPTPDNSGSADLTGAKATISFADVANRTSLSEEQQVWKQNGITVTNDKSESRSNVADYSNPARFYQSSKLTIAYTGMKSIKVVCDTKYKPVDGLVNALEGVSGITVSVAGDVVTIAFASAVDSFEIASLAAQIRVASIAVFTN